MYIRQVRLCASPAHIRGRYAQLEKKTSPILIRKSSIRRLTEEKVHEVISSMLKPLGFKYIKTKSQFKRKVNDYENIFSTQIPFEAIRYDEIENNFFLWFELYSYIQTPKFDKWFKKNTKNEISVYTRTKQFEGYVVLNKEDLNEDDFFTPTENLKFKHEMFGNLLGEQPDINDKNIFDLNGNGKEVFRNESTLLKNGSSLNNFLKAEKNVVFNRYHVSFLDATPYLFVFNKNLEMAKKHFNLNYNKYLAMFPLLKENYPHEIEYFLEFFQSFIVDAKKMADIEYPNDVSELMKHIK